MFTIIEYFQQKEMDQHSKLGAGKQTRNMGGALDKVKTQEKEREKQWKEMLDILRTQMKETELYINKEKVTRSMLKNLQ